MRSHQKPKRARRLRVLQTDVEWKLWFELRDRRLNGHKFRRQMPIDRYVVDFACIESKLVIELDGRQHALRDESMRTHFLESAGWQVLRFWNNEVVENLPGVLQRIADTVNCPHPDPLPQAGEGDELPSSPVSG